MRADNGKVCLVGSLEAEFNSIPTSLQEETKALNKELLVWLKINSGGGEEKRVFSNSIGGPAGKAAVILSSVQGALQMARALGPRKFTAVIEQTKQDLIV